jgi:hypothetical protein
MTKKIVLFGSGTVAEQNLHLNPVFIVDNNPDLQGSQFHDFAIRSPDELRQDPEQYHVVVCTTSISEVKKQLQLYGFIWGESAEPAEQLREKSAIADLENTRFTLLISSGLPASADSFSGGGIHLIEEGGDYPTVKTIYEGNTHGLIKTMDGFAFTCQGRGVIQLDKGFSPTKEIPLRKGLRPHGIRTYEDLWVVVCSTGDCIVGIDEEGNERFCYPISDKIKGYESAQHHCNDLEIIGDYAYVSMFSVSGNWKRGIFDGGIIEFNLKDGRSRVINNTLTMPHSVSAGDGGLYILDSFKGRLLGPNFTEIGQLPGFTRGFDQSDDYFFLGESKNRNFSRLETARSPVSIDSRITVISKHYKFSRSIPLPARISEIHSVILLRHSSADQ